MMDYGDGLRVNCRVRGGEPSTIISSKGPGRPAPRSDRVRVEQRVQVGGLVGRLGQQARTRVRRVGPKDTELKGPNH